MTLIFCFVSFNVRKNFPKSVCHVRVHSVQVHQLLSPTYHVPSSGHDFHQPGRTLVSASNTFRSSCILPDTECTNHFGPYLYGLDRRESWLGLSCRDRKPLPSFTPRITGVEFPTQPYWSYHKQRNLGLSHATDFNCFGIRAIQ